MKLKRQRKFPGLQEMLPIVITMIDRHYLRSGIQFQAAFYVAMVSLNTDMRMKTLLIWLFYLKAYSI